MNKHLHNETHLEREFPEDGRFASSTVATSDRVVIYNARCVDSVTSLSQQRRTVVAERLIAKHVIIPPAARLFLALTIIFLGDEIK